MTDVIHNLNYLWELHASVLSQRTGLDCSGIAVGERYLRQIEPNPLEADVELRLAVSYGYYPTVTDRESGENTPRIGPFDDSDFMFGVHTVALLKDRITLRLPWFEFRPAPSEELKWSETGKACQKIISSMSDEEYCRCLIRTGNWGELLHSEPPNIDELHVCPPLSFCHKEKLSELVRQLTSDYEQNSLENLEPRPSILLNFVTDTSARVEWNNTDAIRSPDEPLRLVWRKDGSHFFKDLTEGQASSFREALGFLPTGSPLSDWPKPELYISTYQGRRW